VEEEIRHPRFNTLCYFQFGNHCMVFPENGQSYIEKNLKRYDGYSGLTRNEKAIRVGGLRPSGGSSAGGARS
jgi:hypothetical protein